MADEKISALPPLTGAVATLDVLPLVDASASETKKISAKHLVQSGLLLIDPDSIPLDKIDTSQLYIEIPDKSVTAVKLAPNSSGIYGILPSSGEFQGQVAVDNGTKLAYMWSGSAWERTAGVVSVDATGISPIQVVGDLATDGTLSVTVAIEPTTAARQFLAGPTASAGNVAARQIIGADLPVATVGSIGAVSPGSGLQVSGTGSLSIDNVVAPSDVLHIVTYDANGLVTDGRAIDGTDLPPATDSVPGVIRPGTGLEIGVDSALNHSNSVIAGTATKITYDAQGHITGALPLQAEDIPDLSFDQITSGEIGSDLLGDCAVKAPNICDYATCLMQEDNPGRGDFLGQFWYTPSTAQLRVYSRGSGPENIWLPVGFGALQANNLRWGGTYDAANDKLGVLTSIAVSEGLTAGQPFPTPTDALSGIYFICQVDGSSMAQPNLNGISHTAGDWALCLDQAQGWIHIDAGVNGGGGGGGGGAQYLNDLLDVQIGGAGGPFSTAPSLALAGLNLLKYDGGEGMWKNTDLIDGGSF